MLALETWGQGITKIKFHHSSVSLKTHIKKSHFN